MSKTIVHLQMKKIKQMRSVRTLKKLDLNIKKSLSRREREESKVTIRQILRIEIERLKDK